MWEDYEEYTENNWMNGPFHSPISLSGGQPTTAVNQNAGQVPTAVGAMNSPDTVYLVEGNEPLDSLCYTRNSFGVAKHA